jgi:hypothetical protein
MKDSRAAFRGLNLALGALVLVLVVAISYIAIIDWGGPSTAAGVSSSANTTAQSTCLASATVAEGRGTAWPPCGCALVDSTPSGSLYVQSDPKVGDNVCVAASMNGTSSIAFTITNSTGSTVFSEGCVVLGNLGGSKSVTGDSCLAFWDTANPDTQGNPVATGTYHLVAVGSSSALEANFSLS